MVVNSECHLSTCSFIENYEQEKADRQKNRMSGQGYQGPELGSLDSKIMDGATEFFFTLGVTKLEGTVQGMINPVAVR